MPIRTLALRKEGGFSYCTCPPEMRGRGRCNHIGHRNKGESISDFIKRSEEILKMREEATVQVQVKGYDFSMPKTYWKTKTNDEIVSDFIVVRGINAQLKEKIQGMDKDQKFFYQKETEIPDPEELKSALKEHQGNKDEYTRRREAFIEQHQDWYEQVPTLQTFKPTDEQTEQVSQFVSEIKDIDTAFYWFQKTGSMIKEYQAYLPTVKANMTTKRQLKDEYKDQMAKFDNKLKDEVGWKGDSFYKALVSKKKSTGYNMRRVFPEITVKETETEKQFPF